MADPLTVIEAWSAVMEDRFWSKVNFGGWLDCWLWNGATSQNGYGQFWLNGRQSGAHRVAYSMLVGPIPDGLVIDHLCRVRQCVNPVHLDPTTQRENVLRGEGPPASVVRSGICKNGHPRSENAVVRRDGKGQDCRACLRDAQRRFRARKEEDR
jgi:HNH endonuclease